MKQMQLLQELRTDRTGVSPVIGVVLIVAITVILSAVTAAVVLGVGADKGPPEASFEFTTEPNRTYKFEYSSRRRGTTTYIANLTTVQIEHKSGDPINTDNLRIAIGGLNGTAYSIDERPGGDFAYESLYLPEKLTAGDKTSIVFASPRDDLDTTSIDYYSKSDEQSGIEEVDGDDIRKETIEDGTKIQIIWSSDEQDQSYILAEHTVEY